MGRDARHPAGPGRAAHWLPTLLVLTLLGGAAAAYRLDWGPRYLGWYGDDITSNPAAVAPPAGLDFPQWSAAPVVADPAAPSAPVDPAAVEAALARGLADKKLGKHVVAAVGDLSGAGAVWTHKDGRFMPASTTKLLTGAAALATLGPDARFATRVVAGPRPRDIVLVGGGDPYLSSKPLTPLEQATSYPERADIATLARKTVSQLAGRRSVRLTYDDSLFSGPSENPKWRADYVPDDIVTPITALWVDRGHPSTGDGRSDDPSLDAAKAFAAELSEAGVRVVGKPVHGTAVAGARQLAAVESARVSGIVERLIDVSDNETAEVMAHQVGLAVSGVGSFETGAAGVMSTLQSLGIETGSDVVYDGSGLSRFNRISPSTMLRVLQVGASAERPDLRSLVTGLPVAGFTGSLANRFASANVAALGDVRAKTGTLSGVSALAGLVTGRDGTPMVFVLVADRTANSIEIEVEAALDGLAGDLAACVCGAS